MADRIAQFANNWSSVLDAEMGPTALTAVVASTTDAPASPCYLVLDLEDPAKREYIWFNDTFTATDFVTLSTANRYLSGSAAPSGITHTVGATIIAITPAQALEDIHDRIDADRSDYDAHNHNAAYATLGHTHSLSPHLAYTEYLPGTINNQTLSTAEADLFGANLDTPFTSPTSGNVLIELEYTIQSLDTASVTYGIGVSFDDGSTIAKWGGAVLAPTVTAIERRRSSFVVTGLSGAKTAAFRVDANTTTSNKVLQALNGSAFNMIGPAIVTVSALP